MSYTPPYARQPAQSAQSAFLPMSVRDFAEAYPDAVLHRAGMRAAQHPLARDILEQRPSFANVARHFLAGQFSADELRQMPDGQAIAFATRNAVYGSAHFASTIVTAYAGAAYAVFDAVTAGFSRVMRSIPVADFKPQTISSFSVSGLQQMPEFAPWPQALITQNSVIEAVSVETWGLAATISRQATVNDQQQELGMAFEAFGNAAALNRSAQLAAALEAGTNTITGYGAVTVAALDAACARLYAATTASGGLTGISPRYVIVPPQMVASAYTTVMAAFGDTLRPDRVDVVVCPHLSSATTFFVCGDPAISPAIGLLHLGSLPESRTLMVEQLTGRDSMVDGIRVAIRDDFRIVRMQAAAVVKVTA